MPISPARKAPAKSGSPTTQSSKPAEMIAALEEAGCELFYAQVFTAEGDPSRFDVIFDAYMGR